MPRLLADALKRRGLVWGARNAETLRLLREGKLPVRRYPSRPQHSLSGGGYVTRIGQR